MATKSNKTSMNLNNTGDLSNIATPMSNASTNLNQGILKGSSSILMKTTSSPVAQTTPSSNMNATTNENNNENEDKGLEEPSARAVMDFLKSRGLTKAIVEFNQFLDREKKDLENENQSKDDKLDDKKKKVKEEGKDDNDEDEEDFGDMIVDPTTSIVSRTELKFNIATGGGLGYDADYMPNTKLDHAPLFSSSSDNQTVTGGWNVKQFVHSFTTLQTWVLNQPDDPSFNQHPNLPQWIPPKQIKPYLYQQPQNQQQPLHVIPSSYNHGSRHAQITYPPPSIKPELLSICFPLLVHSYCSLLESGMENIAKQFWMTWKSLYAPLYPQDAKDLDNLTTTAQMKEFYTTLLTNSEHLSKLRIYKSKEAEITQTREKLQNLRSNRNVSNLQIDQRLMTLQQENLGVQKRVKELQRLIQTDQNVLVKYPFLSRMKNKKYQMQISAHTWRNLAEFMRRQNLAPMYGILQLHCRVIVEARDPLPFSPPGVMEEDNGQTVFDKTKETNLGEKMKTEKTENQINWAAPIHPSSRAAEMGDDPTNIHAGKKRPLPFPKYYPNTNKSESSSSSENDSKEKELNARSIAFNRALRINGFRRLEALEIAQEYESGMRVPSSFHNKKHPSYLGSSIHQKSQRLVGASKTESNTLDSVVNPLQPSILIATCCSGKSFSSSKSSSSSVALTISSNSNSATPHSTSWASSTLDESGIGITCATMSPIGGRRIAVGCEDAAIRIFALDGGGNGRSDASSFSCPDNNRNSNTITPGFDMSDSEMILIGHKYGCPVFDVSWNRDGRNLLSAGGDGSLRLWDTMAVGPYGTLSNVRIMNKNGLSSTTISPSKSTSKNTPLSSASTAMNPNPTITKAGGPKGPPDTTVPGSKAESLVQSYGAALTVYHGHTINTPVWSCEFSPSGYYFASTGADFTGRIWTTDCPKPVRLLAGHYSSVNCVTWHPNCNYVLTGSDDKTVRMWDVQSGKCVRVLAGSYSSVSVVKVSPSGRYAAAADITGVVGLWDLDSGRKVNEFRGHIGEIHGMSYSACGTALATGGDDCAVKLWDVRGAGVNSTVPEVAKSYDYSGIYGEVTRNTEVFDPPGTRKPVKVFKTKQTMILDLQYSKRNLLMSVGKYVTPATA